MAVAFPQYIISPHDYEVCLHWHEYCNWLRVHGCVLQNWPVEYGTGLFTIGKQTYCGAQWVAKGWKLLGESYAYGAQTELENILIANRWLVSDLGCKRITSPSLDGNKVFLGFSSPTFWISDRESDPNVYANYGHLRFLFRKLIRPTLMPSYFELQENKLELPFGLGSVQEKLILHAYEDRLVIQLDGINYLLDLIQDDNSILSDYIKVIVEMSLNALSNLRKKKESNTRPSLDEYYMSIAEAAKVRATCKLKQVGAVIVKNNQVISTGYNGSLPGAQECSATCKHNFDCTSSSKPDLSDAKCQISRIKSNGNPTSVCNTVHAEINAIFQCINNEVSVSGATLYVTYAPCLDCCKISALAGIAKIVYKEPNGYVETYGHFNGYLEIEQLQD